MPEQRRGVDVDRHGNFKDDMDETKAVVEHRYNVVVYIFELVQWHRDR